MARVDVPADVLQTLRDTQARAEELARAVSLLQDQPSCADVESLPDLQRAQVQCARMSAAIELGTCLARLHGESFEYSDPLHAERTMLTAYTKKVAEAINREELRTKKRKLEIDVNAAHRFITHAIPDLTQGAKQELKQVAKKADAGRDGKAKPSLLAKQPGPEAGFETVEAAKGSSAVERARKRRAKVRPSDDTVKREVNPMDLINDVLDGQ